MLLNHLDRSGVMAKKIPMIDKAYTCNNDCVSIGVNKTVAQNDKLVLLINEEKLSNICNKIDLEWMNYKNINHSSVIICKDEFYAEKLKSTLSQWAEIGRSDAL